MNQATTALTRTAVCIPWQLATQYTDWLSKKTGAKYRLPTQKEFNVACRGGSNDVKIDFNKTHEDFYKSPCNHKNSPDESGLQTMPNMKQAFRTNFKCNDSQPFIDPAGSLKAFKHGIYDLLGNVRELLIDPLRIAGKIYPNAHLTGAESFSEFDDSETDAYPSNYTGFRVVRFFE